MGREFMTTAGDNPILDPSEDRLDRAPLAASLATQILHGDASEEGLVVSVLGPWGSGKTSFINLLRHNLNAERVPVLDFNPWMFSGSEHLVQAFFSELTAHVTLKLDLDDIGKLLDQYGDYLFAAPFVGSWAARLKLLLGMAGSWRRPQRSQIEVTRDKIRQALAQQKQPLVVVLDDLDRLTAEEVRDVFRLVRLTASFPNIVYVLTFDRHQVEAALEETGQAGRAYLEKIVQLVFDLPEISHEVLLDELTAAIDESLSGVDGLEPFDDHMRDVWASVLYHIIMPLMRNLRDVRRYCLSVRGTVVDLADEICLPDLLGLEAVRIFLPDTFAQLRDSVDVITSPLGSGVDPSESTEEAKQRVQEIVNSGASRRAVVEALLKHVFPEGGRPLTDMTFFGGSPSDWYQQRRVANTEIFRLYLERREGKKLGLQRLGDQALAAMGDAGAFQDCLQSLEPESLRHVIASLETHEGHFQPEQVIPGVTVLLNTWPTMPEHRGGFFDLDNRMVVWRVVLRLLRALDSPEGVSSAVDVILPQLETLSAQLLLITIIGRRKSADPLVSVQDVERFERSFRDRVRDATIDALAREPELLTVMYTTKKDASASEPELVISSDPKMTRAMLEASKHEVRTAAVGGSVKYTVHLHWETLVEFYDDEDVLRERIGELRAQRPEGLADLLELTDRYLSGDRPPEWPDDE